MKGYIYLASSFSNTQVWAQQLDLTEPHDPLCFDA